MAKRPERRRDVRRDISIASSLADKFKLCTQFFIHLFRTTFKLPLFTCDTSHFNVFFKQVFAMSHARTGCGVECQQQVPITIKHDL